MENLIIKKIKRNIVIPMASAVIGLSVLITPINVRGGVMYEVIEQEVIMNGVVYEKSTQIGDSGILDVHMLKIDITNPNVALKPMQSSNAYGSKDTVLKMAEDSGAVAGVNADFFDMGLSPGTPFGTVIIDGKIVSLDEEHKGYSTFFIDNENNPFIEYIEPNALFLNNGVSNIDISAMNKYKRDFNAVYYDRSAMADTKTLDAKFPELVKYVVRDGVISYISNGGETVEIPENGYVIVAAATYAQHFTESVKVGDTAEIKIDARFDFNAMQEAIGGAGKILEGGEFSNYGYVVGPNARHPRTAMGISQDNKQIILVTVDGRGRSVGATHQEMANIMKRCGAWSAMHLDGGGSTTMVANTNEDDSLNVKNTLSEGSQRKVVNGVGVYSNTPVGAPTSLKLNVSTDKLFVGSQVIVTPVGLDDNLRKTSLPENIQYTSTDTYGTWNNNIFSPSQTGQVKLQASFNGFTAEKAIEVLKLAQLLPNKESISMAVGETTTLSFTGISTTGVSAPISGVSYEVEPKELGEVVDNVFYAKGGKSGYIKCYIADIVTYIDVSLGTEVRWISNFNTAGAHPVNFIPSGDSVKGKVYYSDAASNKGNNAIALEYSFAESKETQAAYVEFKNPIEFPKGASSLVISAYGLNNGGWLRAKIIDGNGAAHLLDLTKEFNQKGWGTFQAKIPDGAAEPIKLERLYIAALSNTDTMTKTVYFDDLGGQYPSGAGTVTKPQSSTYQNPYAANLDSAPTGGAFDITLTGDITIAGDEKPANYVATQNSSLQKFIKDTSLMVYAGTSDKEATGANVYKWTGSYNFTKNNNYAIVQMSAAKGGIVSTSASSWNFVEQAKASPVDHVIIVLDKKPSNFSSSLEYSLFKKALEEIRGTNKNVFVISTEGTSNSTQMIDGVNYINLGGLYNSDKTLNTNFKTLRLRISGANIYYDLQKN